MSIISSKQLTFYILSVSLQKLYLSNACHIMSKKTTFAREPSAAGTEADANKKRNENRYGSDPAGKRQNKHNDNAMRYLNPLNDLTFRKVFGEHSELAISFLNAMLPLSDDELIESLEYVDPDLLPATPTKKNSIVDVRCKDAQGRTFIVEMQMYWTSGFLQRVTFNTSKAYFDPLKRGEDYTLLKPVYSLNLIADDKDHGLPPDEFYHYYRIVHHKHNDSIIDGFHMVFVELSKYKPQNPTEKEMMNLWMRFLTEIDEKVRVAPKELLDNPYVNDALKLLEESAFSDEELYHYDMIYDAISTEKTLMNGKWREGLEKGREEGLQRGREEGLEKGREEGFEKGEAIGLEKGLAEGQRRIQEMVKRMKDQGLDTSSIADLTGLSQKEIE